MREILIFFTFILFFLLLNKYLIKSNLLLDKIYSSKHKLFSNNSSVPLSGGILSLILFLFFFENINYLNKFLFFLIFFIGLMSDINRINSPLFRLSFQVIVVSTLLIINDVYVIDTRLDFIDFFINEFFYFKLFFSIFCFVVLINGSNFIDGVNLLFSGYCLMLSLIILYVLRNFEISETSNILALLTFLIIFISFNFFSKSFLGDGGSYLISSIIGFYLINFYILYQNMISPYFIALLLWYPAFENLFTILRRKIFDRNKIKNADNLHLHHLLFNYLKKIKVKSKINSLTGIYINLFIMPFLLIGIKYSNNTKILVSLIFLETLAYVFSYIYLRYKIDT